MRIRRRAEGRAELPAFAASGELRGSLFSLPEHLGGFKNSYSLFLNGERKENNLRGGQILAWEEERGEWLLGDLTPSPDHAYCPRARRKLEGSRDDYRKPLRGLSISSRPFLIGDDSVVSMCNFSCVA